MRLPASSSSSFVQSSGWQRYEYNNDGGVNRMPLISQNLTGEATGPTIARSECGGTRASPS